MSIKELKIEVKQALETWEQRWSEIAKWDANDIPQKKQDDLVDLAMLSGGELKEALENLIQYYLTIYIRMAKIFSIIMYFTMGKIRRDQKDI